MNLQRLGWNDFFAAQFSTLENPELLPARVIEELKGHYRVRAESGDYLVKVAGSMRFDAGERSDFPAVGDWVGITLLPDKGRATIQALLPRQTKLSRTVAGRRNDEQILAANVDIVFIVGRRPTKVDADITGLGPPELLEPLPGTPRPKLVLLGHSQQAH